MPSLENCEWWVKDLPTLPISPPSLVPRPFHLHVYTCKCTGRRGSNVWWNDIHCTSHRSWNVSWLHKSHYLNHSLFFYGICPLMQWDLIEVHNYIYTLHSNTFSHQYVGGISISSDPSFPQVHVLMRVRIHVHVKLSNSLNDGNTIRSWKNSGSSWDSNPGPSDY